MKEYIRKSEVKAEIERLEKINQEYKKTWKWKFKWFYRRILGRLEVLEGLKNFLNTLEVEDPYAQRIQYDSIRAGIYAYAETYSFNIKSELFNQLTKEQQSLWRKEIEQAVINGGNAGVELAKDTRYADKKVDFEKEIKDWMKIGPHTSYPWCTIPDSIKITAEHFFEFGIKAAQKGE